jgi:hypothetical protein
MSFRIITILYYRKKENKDKGFCVPLRSFKDYTGILDKGVSRWEIDYKLNTWTDWTLFDEYLEIG